MSEALMLNLAMASLNLMQLSASKVFTSKFAVTEAMVQTQEASTNVNKTLQGNVEQDGSQACRHSDRQADRRTGRRTDS